MGIFPLELPHKIPSRYFQQGVYFISEKAGKKGASEQGV
jgi:hypothetical protein